MTIYECLGIDGILLDQQIPIELILENIENPALRKDAEIYFLSINQVSIRASIQRGDHYLQVLEVVLDAPEYIREISFLIQKAIKYRILFVFIYEDRYLIVRRSFNLTMSTENVYSQNVSFCSDWIYDEYLHIDVLYNQSLRDVSEYGDADEKAVEILKTSSDNGDHYLFRDILFNAKSLNKCVAESECVSARWLLNW